MVFACSQTLRKIASTFLEVIKNSSSNCHATATLFLEAVVRTANQTGKDIYFVDIIMIVIIPYNSPQPSDFHFVSLLKIRLSILVYQQFGNPSTFDPPQELSFVHTTEHKRKKETYQKID